MYKLKLTYFDFHGGRGEPARIALSARNIPFEDHRISFETLMKLKPELPFGSVPVLEVDGQTVPQSNAINRFVGRLTDLYPRDDVQAFLCDAILETNEDLTQKLSASFGIKDQAEMRKARRKFVEGPLTTYLEGMERQLTARGGKYFADGRMTVADVSTFVTLKGLYSGNLDYVPTDVVATVAPKLDQYYKRMKNEEIIATYYQKLGIKLP